MKLWGGKNKDPLIWLIRGLLLFAIVFLLIAIFSKPLRSKWSENYTAKGDYYLLQKKYLQADLAYQKALLLSKSNTAAKENRELASKSVRNVALLENFYKENDLTLQLELFAQANRIPRTVTEAVSNSKELIEAEEYQLAVIAAGTAVAMDKSYRDSWLYLGIANLKCAQLLQIKSADRQYYKDKAVSALEQAGRLDPEYAPTREYVEKAKNTKY